jgi:hypothetical protein
MAEEGTGANGKNHACPSLLLDQERLERLCIRNLLASPGERVFFKDLESRFLLVSNGFMVRVSRRTVSSANWPRLAATRARVSYWPGLSPPTK